MSDKKLRNKLIRLAHSNPELRGDLLPLLKEAGLSDYPEIRAVRSAGFDALAEEMEDLVSDTPKVSIAKEVIQTDFADELGAGVQLGDIKSKRELQRLEKLVLSFANKLLGKSAPRSLKYSSRYKKFVSKLASNKTSGCEKLPEGPMRDNCEKKKDEGKGKKARVTDPAEKSYNLISKYKGLTKLLEKRVSRLDRRMAQIARDVEGADAYGGKHIAALELMKKQFIPALESLQTEVNNLVKQAIRATE